jgi:NAD(P)-dependent dehydrogenase (short-subunit alcohol dehydrogenase family)
VVQDYRARLRPLARRYRFRVTSRVVNAPLPGYTCPQLQRPSNAAVHPRHGPRALTAEPGEGDRHCDTEFGVQLRRQSPAGRIVNVSSAGGSLTINADPTDPRRAAFGIYSSSKAALNAITLAFALDLESTRIKVNAAAPGFTATDLNNFQGTRTVEQGAGEPVRLALLDANGPTGTFSNEDGPLPW